MSVQFDLVGFTTTTTGTGTTIDVGAAIPDSGLRTLAGAAIPDGTVVSYALVTGTGSGTQRETGTATVASSGTQLTGRTLVSSTTGSLINLVGTSTVMLGPNRADFGRQGIEMATARLLGRSTAGTGAAEEISLGGNMSLVNGVLDSTGGGLPTGVTSPGNGALAFATGAITTSRPSVNITQTWSAAGVAFSPLKVNITNNASAGTSQLIELQVNGANIFNVRSDGETKIGAAFIGGIAQYLSATRHSLINNCFVGWNGGTNAFNASDVALYRNAEGVLEVNSGTVGTLRDLRLRNLTSVGGVITPSQYTTATRPAWTNGAVIFDSDLDKLVIGGAAAWEVVTSA